MKPSQKKTMVLLMVFALLLGLAAGCTSHSKTYSSTSTDADSQTVVQESRTSTGEQHDYGILGGAFHVVGEVLAFPFDVIAGLFRFIF